MTRWCATELPIWISTIPDWLSDCVCQLAFGGGFASRTLFTNDERSDIYAQRPVILVGIDDFVLRGDLRDRSVFLHLTAIPETRCRTERTIWPSFRADYPRILGGVLDAIVGGLGELPSVPNCAELLPSFACMGFRSVLSGEAATASSP